MGSVGKMIDGVAKMQEKFSYTGTEIESQTTIVNKQINIYYEQLEQQLQQQREDLKKELHKVLTQKTKAVSLQIEQMEHTQAEIASAEELSKAVKTGLDQEALFMKKQIAENVKRLASDYSKFEPVESADVEFVSMRKYEN